MIRASLVGATFSAVGTVLYNQAVGLPWYAGLWYMVPIGMVLGPAMVLSPAFAYAVSVYGIAVGTAVAIDTWSDPNTSAWQKLNASVLAIFAFYAGVRGISYFHENNAVGLGWYRSPRLLDPDFVPQLDQAEVGRLVTESGGLDVVVYTRLSTPPDPSMDLHVTPQPEMTLGVADAASKPLYTGRIPRLLWHRLVYEGFIEAETPLEMGGKVGSQHRISPEGSKLLHSFFKVEP